MNIRNKECDLCPKLSECTTNVCMLERPKHTDIMFLGEYPTAMDDDMAAVLRSKQGNFFRKNILSPLQVDPDDVYFTYAVKCKTPKGRKPSRKEVLHCRDYLEKEIKAVKPKLLLVSGNSALCSVFYLDMVGGISNWRGRLCWSREFNCWVLPIEALWKVLADKNNNVWTEFDRMIEDVKLGLEALYTYDKPTNVLPEWRLLDDPHAINKYLKLAMDANQLAVDLETGGLDFRDEILGISLTYKKDDEYYPVYIPWHWFEEYESLNTRLQNLLNNPAIKIFHNIDFDYQFLYWHGFRVKGPLKDTMMLARLLDENFSMGLKERTWIELDFGGYEQPLEKYKFDNNFTKKTSYRIIPVDIMAPYAAFDTYATYRLWEVMVPKAKKEGLMPLFEKIVMPVRMVETEASINGIFVHMDKADYLEAKMDQALMLLKDRIDELAGREFKFTSSPQLSKLLFEELKAPNGGKTKAGNWKCDKAVLGALAEMKGNRKYTKIAKAILEYKYIDKAKGTYIGQARRYVWDDGRIHSRYNPAGTVTGRTTNSNPCTHNIPKDRLVRSLYGATPGNVLIEADIKAAEMRAIALESQDEVLLDIFRRGEDIHNQTYNEMFGKSRDYIPDEHERRIAKSINFGLIYGITNVGLARRLGISKEQAQKYIDMYFERFTGIAKWITHTIDYAGTHGYVVSKFGRRRRLRDIKHQDDFMRWRAERQAMNSPIQGEASDYTYIGLIRVSRMLKQYKLKAKIVHTVHDCIIVDTPQDEIKKVRSILKRAFLTPVKAFPIKMDVDVEMGELWGEHNDSNLNVILNRILEGEAA